MRKSFGKKDSTPEKRENTLRWYRPSGLLRSDETSVTVWRIEKRDKIGVFDKEMLFHIPGNLWCYNASANH